jgi:sialate O-acetylesterase
MRALLRPVSVLSVGLTGGAALADPRLPAIFGDDMVLQRGPKTTVWGWADPNERIDVEVAGQKRTIYAYRDGTWSVDFRDLPTGGPYTLAVKGNKLITLQNVMVGEVWIGSGQSNMEWSYANARGSGHNPNLEPSDWPNIRLFRVERRASQTPLTDVRGAWAPCDAANLTNFSLVGYYFARRIHQELNVPVGIIQSAWGGTPAEAWTRRITLNQDDAMRSMIEWHDKQAQNYPAAVAEYDRASAEWQRKHVLRDRSNKGLAEGWHTPQWDDLTWPEISLPGKWDQQGLNIDGVVWFRKRFNLPDAWYGRDLVLRLGAIDDRDTTFVNGLRVGSTGEETPNSWAAQRVYRVPGHVLKKGENVIAVRVFDSFGEGGFDASSRLSIGPLAASSGPIDLAGQWKYSVELAVKPPSDEVLRTAPQRPLAPDSPIAPSMLYNGMIAPLTPLAIRGVIWYQGESNAGRAQQYRRLFPLMIRDWRRAWDRGDFPFYFVQLANFMQRKPEPSESAWAELREAQTMALRMPKTGMAVAIDIGDADNIHPGNKDIVGERLARWALAKDYGLNIPYSGPLFRSARAEGSSIRVRFDEANDGLTTVSGQPLKGFAIAGPDRRFVWANARIEGNTVLVSHPDISNPVAVRYAWADNPSANLTNKAGLPASPFRSDDWVTER